MAGIERLSLFFGKGNIAHRTPVQLQFLEVCVCMRVCERERERERENVYVCNFLSINVDAFSVEAIEILISSTTLVCTP